MTLKLYYPPALKIKFSIAFISGFLMMGFFINRSDWYIAAIFIVMEVFAVLISITTYLNIRRCFVFDETGMTIFAGKKIEKHYDWSSLKCVCINNDYLSEKEKKKLERSSEPTNSIINIYDKTRLSFLKRPPLLIQISLLSNREERNNFGYYVPKEEFLSKMNELGVSLHSHN